MLMEHHLKIKQINRIKSISILLIFLIMFVLLYVVKIPTTCIYNQVFGIFCPTCKMTRAFAQIFDLNFTRAFMYNIFSIPLFICIIVSAVSLIIDTVKGTRIYIDTILYILKKYYIQILLGLVISTIINNVIK